METEETGGLVIPIKLPVKLPDKATLILMGAIRLMPGVDGVQLFEDRYTLSMFKQAVGIHVPPLIPKNHRKNHRRRDESPA